MKKELLRINRLNYNYTRTRKLENVSFCILEGECIGFLGLSYSGKDLMTSLLRGELTEGDGSGAIYLGGQKVNDWEVLGKEIYYMCPDNYVIEDWTVAEYLCLVDSGWAGSFWRKGALNEEAGECFAELELDFDISSRMRDLSELEKRIVDVVKAYRKGARIIIIEDEFDGVSQTDIIKFGKIIRRLIQRKLGVIVNSNSNFIMSELSDKFIMLEYLRKLAEYGKTKGLEEIHIEATPLITEFPHSPEVSVQMMKDLEGTDIPIKLLVDWGHALYKPLLKEEADIELWFKQCAPYIGSIHLQQTDGQWDRHWDFTHEGGIITPELIKKATTEAGLDDITQYLEVVTIFEDDDDAVYEGMKKTMDYLHKELGC